MDINVIWILFLNNFIASGMAILSLRALILLYSAARLLYFGIFKQFRNTKLKVQIVKTVLLTPTPFQNNQIHHRSSLRRISFFETLTLISPSVIVFIPIRFFLHLKDLTFPASNVNNETAQQHNLMQNMIVILFTFLEGSATKVGVTHLFVDSGMIVRRIYGTALPRGEGKEQVTIHNPAIKRTYGETSYP